MRFPLRFSMRFPMRSRVCVFGSILAVLGGGGLSELEAVPIPSDQLEVTATMFVGDELGGPNSIYNPRNFADNNFVPQINNTNGVVRYPVGSGDAAAAVLMAGESQTRMLSPMDGGTSTEWLLLSGGSDEGQFSRLPYDAEDTDDRIFAGPQNREPNSFDWVDSDTIVYASYEFRDTIYMADVTADPFTVTTNTTWNAEGAVATDAGRIRNIRVGDVYDNYAYYAEAAVDTDARVWALDLSTGDSTVVTQIEDVSGDGSWGLWTIKEVDGYLYVHASHDGIYVYEMQDATTVGPLSARYTKEDLDDLMIEAEAEVTPNWGFDVADRGNLMLLGGRGAVIEISIDAIDLPGDFNRDGVLDAADIDDLTTQSASDTHPGEYDLNADSLVNDGDITVWIKDLFNSWIGDANLDDEFNSADLVAVLAAGTYEIDIDSVWSTGDFNGDGRTNTGDLVTALSDGGYENGTRPAIAAVPEPTSLALLIIGLATFGRPRLVITEVLKRRFR